GTRRLGVRHKGAIRGDQNQPEYEGYVPHRNVTSKRTFVLIDPAEAETGTLTASVCGVVLPQKTRGLIVAGAVDSVTSSKEIT
ncbi:MAG: hypothetical protein ABSG41_27295, partial [Bryobacteraceae bacterium]